MNASVAYDHPVASDFLQPFNALTAWPTPVHRNARRVERDATVLISQLEYIAATEWRIDVNDGGPEVPAQLAGATQEEIDESMMETLRAMRVLHAELVEGFTVRRIQKDVERFVPHLKQRLRRSIEAARDQIAEIRSLVAFMVGEDDDLNLGVELVPDPSEPMDPEDSYPPIA